MKKNYGDQLNALFERYESAFEDYEAGLLSEIKRKQEEIAELTGLLNRVKGINAPADYYTDDELCALSEIEEYLAKHNKGE